MPLGVFFHSFVIVESISKKVIWSAGGLITRARTGAVGGPLPQFEVEGAGGRATSGFERATRAASGRSASDRLEDYYLRELQAKGRGTGPQQAVMGRERNKGAMKRAGSRRPARGRKIAWDRPSSKPAKRPVKLETSTSKKDFSPCLCCGSDRPHRGGAMGKPRINFYIKVLRRGKDFPRRPRPNGRGQGGPRSEGTPTSAMSVI